MTKEAILYEKLADDKVRCTACARYCEIKKDQIGLCGIRGNKDGKLELFVYGKVIAGHVDPIEKKPVIHYYPGSKIFSIATTGCNWLCKYCQNSDISQRRKVEGVDMSPEQVADTAIQYGAQGIAYTYNEPSIFIEFARDCGLAARKKGLMNIFVSNGYDTPQTVKMMGEFLDAITIDFKGSAEPEFTRKFIGVPNPQPIFDTLLEIRDKTKIHVEITDLIVPKVGDNLEYARKLSKFIYDEFGPEMPIHFLRFHPDYKMMDYESTPVKTLEKHYQIAKEEGLKYVYLGNVPGHPWEHTYCSECNQIVVKRFGFDIRGWNMDKNNKCKFCGNQIPIIGPLHENYKQNRFQFVT
ncbi:MAG TPA: AmmeMemoRadiSam system radical SAM enzyme [Nitrosopumilaceae archaeon]|jgi:pyruvate formate lyase activating enzyme